MPADMRYEVHGAGPWLFLGPPLRATIDDATGAQRNALLNAYIQALRDSYRLVVLDYPPTGADAEEVAHAFTPERACADILDVADHVGADRFAWYGYSWGGVVGLQLAAASARVSALICGGWPPLDAPYRDLLDWGELQYAKTATMGWTVRLIEGHRHDLYMQPSIVVPLVRGFLDGVTRAAECVLR